MSSRKPNKPASSNSSSPPPPPQSSRKQKNTVTPGAGPQNNRRRRRSYADDKDSRRSSDYTIILCVFNSSSSGWRSESLTFRPGRTTDEELWTDIRALYRNELEKPWRRLLLFKKLKHIVPIEFTRSGVPKRQDPKNMPGTHEFTHAYHHPARVRTHREWVDWFVQFKQRVGPDMTVGLEFVEGIWAEKLAAIAVLVTLAIIAVSIWWCAIGGNLQTVFTVMGFVLSGAAAEIALVALYYQITLPG